ncbi:winged helix family transcriptional regulator [bacterium]|nr:MAG: winged helix family transcriptional regulator [bacterium]
MSLVERTVRVDGAEVPLTRLEFELLAFLLKNKDRVLKRVEILEAVWKYPQEVETRTLDKHVETLRRKLGDSGRRLKTIHGVGYRFFDAEPTAA